ncbi:lysophospholipid acyltransferase family protein [Longivirga aurantiaca]|uniref:Lysophospholipid acyltransferase family protein n=1 Tax=Longivirga aurantiaca TaxID=1837743 RepID=A0ABW1T0S1_9ACTN
MVEPVYAPVVITAKALFKGLGLHIDLSGTEHIPRSGGAVLASNHIGYMDFIFAGLGANPAGRYVRFMAKDSIWKNPVAGPLMRGMKHIPVDRTAGAESFRIALDHIKNGEIVGIFPEATISRSFEIKDFKSGAARLAMDGGVPLIPTVLWGTHRIMTKGRPRDFSRGKAVSVSVGAPIDVPPGSDLDAVGEHLHEVMRGMLDDAIARYPQKPSGPDDTWWLPARLGGTAPTLPEATRADRLEALERARRKSDTA